ncbi:hypothetical protein JOE58_002986 [Curtobacterium luteum]|uniref:Uncharacterized protein n=1 Tax=Curtobacterium luteum TaxID=33881 RepID=A0ABS2RXJ0_9MICO|nr:hypothetical protein [Curtobacterium luteum]MBM7803735.1 hypothetical protein [Curtobacterium luteum]
MGLAERGADGHRDERCQHGECGSDDADDDGPDRPERAFGHHGRRDHRGECQAGDRRVVREVRLRVQQPRGDDREHRGDRHDDGDWERAETGEDGRNCHGLIEAVAAPRAHRSAA